MSFFKTCAICGATYAGPACPSCVATRPDTGETAVAAEPLTKGQTFRGFEILEPIGRGGMGVVYKARQPSLDRLVALKILPPEKALLPGFGDRFEREAKFLAALAHPNIVTIYDSGKENGLYFFAMEFVEGVSLKQRLRQGALSIEETVSIGGQICDALAFAHAKGVIHRDIKPDNVLLDAAGRAKVTDFGIAKLVATAPDAPRLTETGGVVGTAAYIAPEQIESSRDVDHRADIYSTGVVLYEMVTGQLPIGRFDSPSDLNSVNPRIDAVILKALAKKPEKRYSTAIELKNDLTAVTGSAAAPAPPRRRRPYWIAPLAILAMLAAVAILLRPWKKAPPDPTLPPEEDVERIVTSLLPDAAAVDATLWTKIAGPIKDLPRSEEISSHPLTYLFLRQRPPIDLDFRILPIKDARRAMERAGRITVLQPEYIKSVSFRRNGASGQGTCLFECPAYSGTVEFAAIRKDSGWEITEFRCPKSKDRTERRSDGGWKGTFASSEADRPPLFEELRVLPGHTNHVFGLAFSRDGKTMASGSSDGTVKFWELGPPPHLPRTVVTRLTMVLSVAFTPNGKLLAASGGVRGVYLFDVETQKEVGSMTGHLDPVRCVAFSPDGKRMATASQDKTVKLWDPLKDKELRTLAGHAGSVWSVAFHPHAPILASGSEDKTVKLWDLAGEKSVETLIAHAGTVRCVAFSPDGRILASASDDQSLILWDVAAHKVLHTLKGHGAEVTSAAFHPTGKFLASGSKDNSVKIWDTTTGLEIASLEGHKADVLAVAFRPDGRMLASASRDRTVRLWVLKK